MPIPQPSLPDLKILATLSLQAEYLRDFLSAFSKQYGGGPAKVMANMAHLWEELFTVAASGPGQPYILIVWAGDTAQGGDQYANKLHRVKRTWNVIVLRGHGWISNTSGPNAPQSQETPFYQVLEDVRDSLRTTTCISQDFPIDYKSTRPVPNPAPSRANNVFLDAYQIEFACDVDIPEVSVGGLVG